MKATGMHVPKLTPSFEVEVQVATVCLSKQGAPKKLFFALNMAS